MKLPKSFLAVLLVLAAPGAQVARAENYDLPVDWESVKALNSAQCRDSIRQEVPKEFQGSWYAWNSDWNQEAFLFRIGPSGIEQVNAGAHFDPYLRGLLSGFSVLGSKDICVRQSFSKALFSSTWSFVFETHGRYLEGVDNREDLKIELSLARRKGQSQVSIRSEKRSRRLVPHTPVGQDKRTEDFLKNVHRR